MWGLGRPVVRVGLGWVSWGWLCWPGVAVRGRWVGVRAWCGLSEARLARLGGEGPVGRRS